MRAIVIGAGRIGRGFIAELLVHNHCDITFFDQNEALINELCEKKQYEIHVLGNEQRNTIVKDYEAYLISNHEMLNDAINHADILFTAVGGKYLVEIAPYIAESLAHRHYKQSEYLNLITCENWIDAGKTLEHAVINEIRKKSFDVDLSNIGFSEAVILTTGTGAPDSTGYSNIDTWVEDRWYLPVDRSRIKGAIPELKYIDFIDNYNHLLKQKLYTNNTSVALIAYLGVLKGYRLVSEAANDKEIDMILTKAYEEIDEILIKGLGVCEENQKTFSKNAKAKYQDDKIVDEVHRIARDPIRKLGIQDRLIGPALLAFENNIQPYAISLAIAAAIYYQNEEDDSAKVLNEMLNNEGMDTVLDKICQIPLHHLLRKMIKEAVEDLRMRGWLKGVKR